MAEIPTLSGPVSPENLGIVSLHEHLLFGVPGWQHAPEVDFDRPGAFDQIASSLRAFKQLGGGTIVDASGITLGRAVNFYSRLAQVTGVQIVASTGFGNQPLSILPHFSRRVDYFTPGPEQWHREVPGSFYPSHGGTKEYLMFLFYHELATGMVESNMTRTKLRAGLVKAGASWGQVTEAEELSLRGAALAAKRAGVSVITSGVNQARRQLAILLEEGLEPERIVIGHCDDGRALDLERDKEIAQKGACVAYDHIGWEDSSVPYAVPDERRVEMVKAMVAAGFADHVILSCNAIGYAIGMPQPKHSFGHLLKSFVPRLKKAGVSQKTIDTILIENPKRILTRKKSV